VICSLHFSGRARGGGGGGRTGDPGGSKIYRDKITTLHNTLSSRKWNRGEKE